MAFNSLKSNDQTRQVLGIRKDVDTLMAADVTLTASIATNTTNIATITAQLDDCAQSIVTASRALGTDYQNTSGKIMFVTVSIAHVVGANSCLNVVYVEAGDSTPDTPVARIATPYVSGEAGTHCISFIVPPGSYYMVSDEDTGAGANSSLVLWTEWTIL